MKEYKVKSSSSNKIYTVRYFEETDKWVCECPSYIFNPEGFKCKHIKQVKKGRK